MDTDMHAAAMPDSDRSQLAAPADVAARIIAILESRWPATVRVIAAAQEAAA